MDTPGFDLYPPVDSELRSTDVFACHRDQCGLSPDGSQLASARNSERDGGIFAAADRRRGAQAVSASFAQDRSCSPRGLRMVRLSLTPPSTIPARKPFDCSRSVTPGPGRSPARPLAGTPVRPPGRARREKLGLFVCMTSIAVYGIYIVEPMPWRRTPPDRQTIQGFLAVWRAPRDRIGCWWRTIPATAACRRNRADSTAVPPRSRKKPWQW